LTLAEFALRVARCAGCGEQGGHRVVLDVVECRSCGAAWRASVPHCYAGPESLAIGAARTAATVAEPAGTSSPSR
jgi:hypothetical protein